LYVHRRTGRVPSALGLTATGIAAAYLDLVAATAVYHFIPTVVGLSLAAVVAVAGLAIARQWSSELLAVIVVLGVAMLAPAIGADRHGVVATFLVLLTIASTTAHVGQPRWAWLEWARTAPTVAYLLWALTFGALTVSPGHDSVVALSVVLTLSLLAVTTAAARAPQVALLSAAPLALTALPTLYGLGRETGWAAFAGLLAIAVLHLGAGVMAGAQRGRVAVDRVAVWAPPIAAAFALVAIDQADFGSWQLTAVLVLALLHLARARISSDTVVGWTALVVSAVALLGWLAALGPLTVADRAVEITVEDLINHGLVLAVAVLLAQAAPRLLRALQGPDAGAAGTEPRPSSPVWIGG
ncbi:DUF2339 domain-containing protein, partial [Kribbia dieselivorans]|uniref:DUF2339 domain-containing protein n=1 Tax=Kribbia dieselivorans TaxID=331526 RepID=UPI00146FE28D